MHGQELTPEATWDAIRDPSRPLRRAIRLVHEANEMFIAQLRAPCGSLPDSPFQRAVAALCPTLTDTALATAARVPYLLFDFCFGDSDRWSQWGRKTHAVGRPPDAYWTGPSIDGIVRTTATIAWITCSQNPRHAGLTLGASSAVARIIAALQLRDLSRIAAEHSSYLRPRWEHQPHFWHRYLASVQSGDEPARLRMCSYGIQLLAGTSRRIESANATAIVQSLQSMDSNSPVLQTLARRPRGSRVDRALASNGGAALVSANALPQRNSTKL